MTKNFKRGGSITDYVSSRIGPSDENGCTLWLGTVSRGYGVIHHEAAKNKRAHRYVYECRVGPVPDGLSLDHLCRNRSCVNHEHLEPVTGAENTWRGFGTSTINRNKTHCKRGHEFSEDNIYRTKRGDRACRTCRAMRNEEAKSQYRAIHADWSVSRRLSKIRALSVGG